MSNLYDVVTLARLYSVQCAAYKKDLFTDRIGIHTLYMHQITIYLLVRTKLVIFLAVKA